MRTSNLVKSKFWRGADLKGQPAVVLTIADVTEELMSRGGGKVEPKCFLWFNENLKGLQLNKSRVAILELAYGPETDFWTGKRVRLSYDPTVMMAGVPVGGVKISTPAGIVYDEAQNPNAGAWGEAPPGAPIPTGAKAPVPVLNPATGVWELPAQKPPAQAARPPTPVLNPATGQWELPPQKHVPPPTISQRIAAGHPAPATDEGWSDAAKGTVDASTGEILPPEFDDDIPF
jgi:hypothetical protein